MVSGRARRVAIACAQPTASIACRWRQTCSSRILSCTGPIGSGWRTSPTFRPARAEFSGPRPVHPQGSWLGHARAHACRTHHHHAHHGNPTARRGSGPHPLFRWRQPIRRQRVSRCCAGCRHHPIDEPQGELLGQCANGELLSAL